jgi:hypothetical protein
MHTQTRALTIAERVELAQKIIAAMREAYEAEGVEGDFDDGERYLRDDAGDDELIREEEKWCNKV